MDSINELDALGVNTQEALRRFSGNSALYVKMLGKLTAAANDLEVMPCIEKEDYETAVTNAHTLKGVTGNLSLTPLYNAYTDITICFENRNTATQSRCWKRYFRFKAIFWSV